MQLTTTSKTYHHLDDDELDRFAEAYYGRPYSTVASFEARNDSVHTATARLTHLALDDDGQLAERPGLDPHDQEQVAAWRAGHGADPRPDVLLSDLACRGLAPAGDYLIAVCW